MSSRGRLPDVPVGSVIEIEGGTVERPSILIIDDEESMRRFLTVLLEKEGYRVVSAASGRAALRQLEDENFQIAITDLKMPDMDGIAVLEGIKEGTGSNATFTWLDTEFLQENRVRAYSHMPLWMPAEGSSTGFNRFDLSRILARGIKYRPLPVTARDTLEYHKSRPEERQSSLRAGITAERETELLEAWHIRGG